MLNWLLLFVPIAIGLEDLLSGLEKHWVDSQDDLDRGRIFAQASRDQDEVLTADLDLDMIAEVRNTWQFFRDRRPDMYESLVKA